MPETVIIYGQFFYVENQFKKLCKRIIYCKFAPRCNGDYQV